MVKGRDPKMNQVSLFKPTHNLIPLANLASALPIGASYPHPWGLLGIESIQDSFPTPKAAGTPSALVRASKGPPRSC